MGICNAPATFQQAMNVTFQNFVNKTRLTNGMINFCVIVYMDDILVYSETYHGHAQHIEWMLGVLRDAGFKIALEKSEFFLSEISFLGYVVTRGGLRPDSRKVAAVKDAPIPTLLTQLVDDLPLDIVSQCDESPVPRVLSRTLTPYLEWSVCLEEQGDNNNPSSQREYLDPRRIIDLAFFQPRTASEDEGLTLEEEEEEGVKEGDEEEEEESEWETLGEEAECTETKEEDPEAARRREEIAVEKQPLEFASGVDLAIPNDPAKDPEPPKNDDGNLAAEISSAAARRRRSRSPSPSPSARPPIRSRADAGHRASSPVLIPSSP
ncbi:hypothetical protein CBR_g4427 [Chara braunii]|uniref:Reverse transcriptase domain-containing protein n=1 Tax=Chara braunii TaxID=69332 RepID=A0A388KHW2_CHABU|nr:hypothetical protein CBR_g4427 [Chara braunii]|eukprot:GBG69597.1 hypothetical protein CBR_g4427 [Chara braunii]